MSLNKTGLLYFHQGWTDIFNCLALIDYYNNIYNELYLLIREDSKEIINFYCQNKNIKKIYVEKNILDNCIIKILKSIKFNYNATDFLGIGIHDQLRRDKYRCAFNKSNDFFVTRFYKCYDINPDTRFNMFNFTRNDDLENKFYNRFVKDHKVYNLVHEDVKRNIIIKEKPINCLNLDGSSDLFFDSIKVLENAKEIHLIDSVWASFIFILDKKFKLFKDINIYLYTKRDYISMFENSPSNWKII